jgi:ATP-dependent Lon protease
VRELNKKIAKISRKIARKIAAEEKYPKSLKISNLKEVL